MIVTHTRCSWLIAIAVACLASGCGGGGGKGHSVGAYSLSVLPVPPEYTISQAFFIDDSGTILGIVSNDTGWFPCVWQADGRSFSLLHVSEDVLSYVLSRMPWELTTPFRISHQGWITYPADDSPRVVDLLSGRTVLTLSNLPEAARCVPSDVNDTGVCVGRFETVYGSGEWQPMMWSPDGLPKKLSLPGGCTNGEADAVNNAGQILGTAFGPSSDPYSGILHVVIWNTNGSVAREVSFTPDEGAYINGTLVSDTGYVVVDHSYGVDSWFEIISPTGTVTKFIDPRGPSYLAQAKAMNSRGQVAGVRETGPVICSPNGAVVELPLPSPEASCEVADLNDSGVAVGYAQTRDPPRTYAVRWIPN